MATLRTIQRRFSPHPELTRKAFHVSMGLFTLSLPAIFDEAWPVVAMALGTVAALVAIRTVRPLREQFGRIIGGVDRFSLGEVYFAVSVAVLFYLSDGNRLLFAIPMLILTLADATAALIGIRYGQVRFSAATSSSRF
jgi:phytol kinase